jgi:hypothetical protein
MRHCILMAFAGRGMRWYYNIGINKISLNTKVSIPFSALIPLDYYFIAGKTKIRLEILVAALIRIVECAAYNFASILIFLLVSFVTGKYGQIIK